MRGILHELLDPTPPAPDPVLAEAGDKASKVTDSNTAELYRRFTRPGHTPVSRIKAHADAVRAQARDDGLRHSRMGECLTFPDSQTRIKMGVMFDLDHPDWEIRRRGIERFKKSHWYRLFSPHKRKVF